MPLARVSVPDLLAEVRAMDPEPGVARAGAFDADGTLWQGDIGLALFESALRRGLLRSEAAAALAVALRSAEGQATGDRHRDAERLLELYREDLWDEREAIEMMAWCFAGHSIDDMRALTAEVLAEAGHPGALHEGVRALVEGLRLQGVPILVASGSPFWAVEEACRPLGIGAESVLAMTPRTDGRGVIAPTMMGRPLLALGDSPGDLPMLEDAQLAVAVLPRPAVLSVAERAPARWRVLAIDRTESGRPVVAPAIDRMVI